MADNSWFEGTNSPGAGDLGQMQALQQNLARTADAAKHARTSLSGLKDQVSDAVWRGRPAEEFKNTIDSDFLGQLDKLDTSYSDAADGFATYIAAVSDIKHRADGLARRIYDAQGHYETVAGALQSWLHANPESGSYSHGDLAAPGFNAGAPYTVSYHPAPSPAGVKPVSAAAATAASSAADAQRNHAALQREVDDAYAGLQALYRQMDQLKTHDRVAADNAVVGKIDHAGSEGMRNESGWHKFFHALSTVAKWVGVALLVVAVVAVLVALPEVDFALLPALGAATSLGGAAVSIGGVSISLASVAIIGSAATSALALVGDVGQTATGGGPGAFKIGLDVLGIVPGLGTAARGLSRLGGPVGDAAEALHSGALSAKLAASYKLESLFDNAMYSKFGMTFPGLMDKAEKGFGKLDNALLGYGEVHGVDSLFGEVKWLAGKAGKVWGTAGPAFLPAYTTTALIAHGKAYVQSLAHHDLTGSAAQAQIRQYQQTDPVAAAKARQIAANLAKGTGASVSFPRQLHYPQTVPVH